MKNAIVLLGNSGVQEEVDTLLYSLKKWGADRLADIVMFTDEPAAYEGRSGITRVIPIEFNKYSQIERGARVKYMFYKWEVFRLQEYERLLYLDSDLVCMGDVSELFGEAYAECDIAMAPDGSKKTNTYRGGVNYQAGVMLFNRRMLTQENMDHLLRIAERQEYEVKSWASHSDQGAINEFVFQKGNNLRVRVLDYRWNMLKRELVKNPRLYKDLVGGGKVRFIHYVGVKPKTGEPGYAEVERFWLECNQAMRLGGAVTTRTVVLLGMHCSTASGVAKALAQSTFFGERFVEKGKKENPEGYWEDVEFVELNDRILKAAGGTWSRPPSEESILAVEPTFEAEIAALVERRNRQYPIWGWKDPRSVLTIRLFWKRLINPVVYASFRSGLEVARALNGRAGAMPMQYAEELACEYNRRLIRFLSENFAATSLKEAGSCESEAQMASSG